MKYKPSDPKDIKLSEQKSLNNGAVNSKPHKLKFHKVIARVLGKKSITVRNVEKAIERGLSIKSLYKLAIEYNTTSRDIAHLLDINMVTLMQRGHRKLSLDESKSVIKFSRLKEKALAMTLGNNDAAITWLHTPLEIFDHKSPIQHSISKRGSEEVEELINRIIQGIFS